MGLGILRRRTLRPAHRPLTYRKKLVVPISTRYYARHGPWNTKLFVPASPHWGLQIFLSVVRRWPALSIFSVPQKLDRPDSSFPFASSWNAESQSSRDTISETYFQRCRIKAEGKLTVCGRRLPKTTQGSRPRYGVTPFNPLKTIVSTHAT